MSVSEVMEVQNLEGMVKGLEFLLAGWALGIIAATVPAYIIVKYDNMKKARHGTRESTYEITR